MPVAVASEFALCPPGRQHLFLKSVKEVEGTAFGSDEKIIQWEWTFESTFINQETAKPFELRMYTGYSYGDSRAKLTFLFNNMLPGLTKKEYVQLNTDVLCGKWYPAKVTHQEKQDKSGMKAVITDIDPAIPGHPNDLGTPTAAQSAAPPVGAAPAPGSPAAPTTGKLKAEILKRLVVGGNSQKEAQAILNDCIANGDDLQELLDLVNNGGYDKDAFADGEAQTPPTAAVA